MRLVLIMMFGLVVMVPTRAEAIRQIPTVENDNYQQQQQGQAQGQIQGNLGIQRGNDVRTSVDGDSNDFDSYSFSPPGLSANKGVGETQMNSIFGGIGFAGTEEYTVLIDKLAVIERMQAAGYLSTQEAYLMARGTYAQFDEATQPKRVLGFLWQTRGRHLGNLFGALSMDDIRFKVPLPHKPSGDDVVAGNAGNL